MNFNKHLKIIDNFPNYKISADGRVFNKTGELKQHINRNGYPMVSLNNNGYRRTYSVHRLVAENFIDNPDEKRTVNHIDGNKLNNTIDNLEWCTYSENIQHTYDNSLRVSYLTNEDRINGARISGMKLQKGVRVIETGEEYSSLRECAKDLKCDPGAISKCCNGKAIRHHGYHFEWI